MPRPSESMEPAIPGPTLAAFRAAVESGDAGRLRQLLDTEEGLSARIDAPIFSFGKTAVIQAAAGGHRETIEALLDHGADLDRLSDWGPGGFGVLHSTCFDHPELASWLVQQGAHVDIHAAAGLGDRERLVEILNADAEAIRQRGPDGQFPLHFSADTDIAALLIERGADLDARCLDHDSTAAQWAVKRAPELARYLVERGAEADIFLAVALGDEALVQRIVEGDPACLRARLGRPGYAPAPPGNILCWTLGWWAEGGRASPHRIARAKGHAELYTWLLEKSPPDVQLMVHAWHGENEAAKAVLAEHADVVEQLESEDRRFLADVVWDNRVDAVRILLEAGFDPHVRGDHASTPLDRAAFHGFADSIALLLEHDPNPPLEAENEFGGSVLGTLVYGSRHSWRDEGDFPRAAVLLAEAGVPVLPHTAEQGREDVREALLPFVDPPPGRSRQHEKDMPPVDGAALGSLEILFDPNPTDVHVHERHAFREPDPSNPEDEGVDERPSPWIWYYRTEIRNRSELPLRLIWLDAFFFEHERWIPGNGRGRAIESDEIRELFSEGELDDGWLSPGSSIARAVAWITGYEPSRPPVKWAVVASDADGTEHYAEAEIGLVPYGTA